MDFQRLVLFVIFAMSGVFLFQAWQKENAPPKPVAAVTTPAEKKGDVPSAATGPAAAPAAGASNGSLPAAGAALPATANAPGAPTAGTATGEVFTVSTDLFDVKINTLGGVIEEVALKEHRDAADKTKPYQVLLKSKDRVHVAQTGLLGSGLPNHYSLYSRPSGPLALGSAGQLEVRMSTPLSTGGKDDLVYTFKRGSYIIDVTHEVSNGGAAAMAPTAYFQVQRDSVATGVNNPMGGGAFHGPVLFTDEKKYQKRNYFFYHFR